MTIQSDTLSDRLRHIKLSLRGVMNGVTSASMRQKGLNYKLIFGVELPRLREMAEELPHDYDLAAALWKEDIRECRLLAGSCRPSGSTANWQIFGWNRCALRKRQNALCTTSLPACRAPRPRPLNG